MMNNDHDYETTMPAGPLASADDPRMLAFLLGELEDADRTHVETFLANTPDAEAELNDLRSMLGLLETEIASDGPAPKLHTSQRDEIVAATHAPVNEVAKAASVGGSSGVWLRVAATVAATAALGVLALEFIEGSTPPHASLDESSSDAVAMYDTSPMERIRELKAEDDKLARLVDMGYMTFEEAEQSHEDAEIAKMLSAAGYLDASVVKELKSLGYSGGGSKAKTRDPLSTNARGRPVRGSSSLKASAPDVGRQLETLNYVDNGDQVVSVGGATGGRGGNGHPSAFDPAAPGSPVDAYTTPETETLFVDDGGQGGYGIVQLTGTEGATTDAPTVGLVQSDGDVVPVDEVMRVRPTATPETVTAARERLAGPSPSPGAVMQYEPPATNVLQALGYVDPDSEVSADELRIQLEALSYVDEASTSGSPGALSGRGRKAPLQRRAFVTDGRQLDNVRTRSIQREGYAPVHENSFVSPRDPQHARSTFGLDVDTASYANMRRFLNDGRLPPPDAIRIEELVNYFDYETKWADDVLSEDESPIALRVEGAWAPWSVSHRLVRLSMKAVAPSERPPANIVFLVDVSGSMKPADRLPLLKSSMRLLVSTLHANDRVAIVTYNDTSGTTLESTTCDRKDIILAALDSLRAGGSTNGEAGLRQAYKVATQHFIEGGVNRVILASDGDFNVGAQTRDELYGLITQQAQSDVFLTVLGFGTDNLQDSNLELLADKGNGHYAYIDSLAEGEKVLINEAGSTLQTVAKDVKIQVEFNPAKVQAYRLLGYENRALAAKDFNDDRKDAGDVGAGHTVTALYEIVPTGVEWEPQVDDLKYQTPTANAEPDVELSDSPEMLTAKLRFKRPDSDTSELIEVPFVDQIIMINARSLYDMLGMDDDFRLAAAAAQFGMVMRGSVHAGTSSFDSIVELAESIRSPDPRGYRAEFIRMVKMAKGLSAR